jgi:hypothetical protein
MINQEIRELTNKIIEPAWVIKEGDEKYKALFTNLDGDILTIQLMGGGPFIKKTAIEVFRNGYVNGTGELRMLRTIYEKDLLTLLIDNQEEYTLYRVLFANGCNHIKSTTHTGFVFSKFIFIDNKIAFLYTGSSKTGIAPIIEETSVEVFLKDVYAASGERALQTKMSMLITKINTQVSLVKTDDEVLNLFLTQDETTLNEIELLTYNNMLKENITKIIG